MGLYRNSGEGSVVGGSVQALEPLEPQFYAKQLRDATPITSVRGVWRVREARADGSQAICKGRLTFRGFEGEPKGTVEYKGCKDRQGKGRWILKPGNIAGGKIMLSARWKIKFPDGTAMMYRGDVYMDEAEQPFATEPGQTAGGVIAKGAGGGVGTTVVRPNAHIRGDVLEPVTDRSGTLGEKRVGDFQADLLELPDDTEKL
ncbi:unnamed protein product [Choristocarpus tenellus]